MPQPATLISVISPNFCRVPLDVNAGKVDKRRASPYLSASDIP